jgi:hypothetical protein
MFNDNPVSGYEPTPLSGLLVKQAAFARFYRNAQVGVPEALQPAICQKGHFPGDMFHDLPLPQGAFVMVRAAFTRRKVADPGLCVHYDDCFARVLLLLAE